MVHREFIYRITSPVGKHYIGRTDDLADRMAEHRHSAKAGSSFRIHKAIRKYGFENMKVEPIDEAATKEGAQLLEGFYIRKFDTVKNGYNDTYDTGGGNVWIGLEGSPRHQAFIQKMTRLNRGENNGMFGKKHSAETHKVLRKKAEGRYSRPWFIARFGLDEGVRRYEERCAWLRSRRLPKGKDGKFVRTDGNVVG